MEKTIRNLMETLTEDDVNEMLAYLPASKKEPTRYEIINDFMNIVLEINEFNGESMNMYEDRMAYVEYGGFERDYFAVWYENYDCANGCLPLIEDVSSFCYYTNQAISMWLYAVECGYIEPDDHWGE